MNDTTRADPPTRRPATRADAPLLEIVGIDKSFGQSRILKGCSLDVRRGETVVLIGPSGSGKSTLLRCVNLLEPADGGDIFFEGANITGDFANAARIRREIGMVFQNFELFQHLSAAQNIMLAPMKVLGLSRADAHDVALDLLRKVRISDKADAFPDELSGGQQQRVAIARALAMKPKLMLYDEPTSALDPEMIREVLDVMADLSAEGMTSLVVTHEMGFARRAADKIVFMEDGRIVETASSEAFFGGSVNERAQRFLDQILH
uniref:amino acid ABC transporter ATP-binding protein n=1 Tax=Ancylobacter mangrovi TaxID=2972472 RepID=UPI002867B1F8|nr:amino acid ABC transporter ATP-binding protein [Ancylobacter mangrovi]